MLFYKETIWFEEKHFSGDSFLIAISWHYYVSTWEFLEIFIIVVVHLGDNIHNCITVTIKHNIFCFIFRSYKSDELKDDELSDIHSKTIEHIARQKYEHWV